MPIPPQIFVWKRQIGKALMDHDHTKAGCALLDCQETELLLCCDSCAHRKYVVYSCQHRACPICGYRLAQQRADFAEAMLKEMKYPKLITLTMPTWTQCPREGIKFIRKKFAQLRARKLWRPVRGGCYGIELIEKTDGWHIHIHTIIDAPYLPKQHIFSAWRDLLGMSYASIDVRAARTPAQRRYACKYVGKGSGVNNDAAAMVRWYEAVKGSRLFGTFGAWYNARAEDFLNDSDEPQETIKCECCGAEKSMFYARDGPWIYGKAWEELKDHYCRGLPDSRPLEVDANGDPSPHAQIDFSEELFD